MTLRSRVVRLLAFLGRPFPPATETLTQAEAQPLIDRFLSRALAALPRS